MVKHVSANALMASFGLHAGGTSKLLEPAKKRLRLSERGMTDVGPSAIDGIAEAAVARDVRNAATHEPVRSKGSDEA